MGQIRGEVREEGLKALFGLAVTLVTTLTLFELFGREWIIVLLPMLGWSVNAGVSDGELQQELHELLTSGARTEAWIVAHLAEVDARKLHLAMGASSLFDYCLSRLKLSNNEAFHRITAARLARRFPIIFELLERRDVHLTAVCLLRDHLPLRPQPTLPWELKLQPQPKQQPQRWVKLHAEKFSCRRSRRRPSSNRSAPTSLTPYVAPSSLATASAARS